MTETAKKFARDQAKAVKAPPPEEQSESNSGSVLPVGARAPPLPVFCTMSMFEHLTGMSRRAIYEALGRGDLVAKKRGSQTLIDCEAGLRWLRSLPPAKIKPARKRASSQ